MITRISWIVSALSLCIASIVFESHASVDISVSESTKKQIIVVTNLEDILIRKDLFSMASGLFKGFLKAKNKCALMRVIFSGSFLRDCYLASRKELTDRDGTPLIHKNEYIAYFARVYPALKKHEEKLLDILNEYIINEEMVAYYLWLKVSKNYRFFVATNKNRASYRLIKKKLDALLQKRFGIRWKDLFDGAFYVDKINKESNFPFTLYSKPNEHYFLGLWNYLCASHGYTKESVHIMYIDDAEPNILAAQATQLEYDIPLAGVYYQYPIQIKNAILRLAESLEKHAFGILE